MIDWYPVMSMILIGTVWAATAWQSGKLYALFFAKYPRVAQECIPFAGAKLMHPEKALFFFRKTSLPLLQADPVLWKMRQHLKVLLLISLVLPFACFSFLIICAITETARLTR
jgi:hypothetical protein